MDLLSVNRLASEIGTVLPKDITSHAYLGDSTETKEQIA